MLGRHGVHLQGTSLHLELLCGIVDDCRSLDGGRQRRVHAVLHGHAPFGGGHVSASGQCVDGTLVLKHVEIEVVRAGKRLIAVATREGFLPGVTSVMTGQLIGSSEGPVASLPRATEGFLSRVDPPVGLEVRTLGVHLGAPWVVTAVHLLELAVGVSSTGCCYHPVTMMK